MLVALQTGQGRLDFLVRGEQFTSYGYGDERAVPGFSELNAPGRRAVTREEEPGGLALCLVHGNVEGVAFGVDGQGEPGRIVTLEMTARRGSQTVGFQQECAWIVPDGRRLLTEARTARVHPGPGEARILDLSFRLVASEEQAVSFGRTEESFLRVRAASSLFPSGGGQVRNSEGTYDADGIHGRSAAWVACVGVVQAETVGFAFLDHPDNPWHPPPWIAREDGTLSPSPFAWREMELAASRAIFLRYRLIVHRGYVDQGWADARLAEYVREA
ncbi:MAG TPA: DUF6807 family protein [Chthonomonadaceae bacterium]|nr:DUF6807 family protein [Chthonomonadaceae bacterium]